MSPADVFEPETEDRSFARDQMVRDWLRKPFRPEQIGKLPATQKRPALDFVGHAAVTDRLNKIAPDWSYSVLSRFAIGETVWIHGSITVGGVTREEFGDGDDPKEAIGNFIRRAAMRFGVAIDLWSREELSSPPLRGEGEPSGGKAEGAGKVPKSSSLDERWAEAAVIGLTPAKAVILARKLGLDHVRSAEDLVDGELEALIVARKAELQ